MTKHETMNTIIHAAFRRDLARFDAAFASFPAASGTRADQLGAAWDNLSGQLHHHHQDEETIFWPALNELHADPAVVSQLEAEHATMLAALGVAETTMQSFRADPSSDNVAAARTAVADLADVLTAHLAHEERDLEPFAIANRSTPQFKAALRKVRRAHAGNGGTFFAWLSDGADADAKAGLRHEVPAPVLFALTRIVGRDYNKRIAPVWT